MSDYWKALDWGATTPAVLTVADLEAFFEKIRNAPMQPYIDIMSPAEWQRRFSDPE